ncbi:MAG: late competence development ComFB family protein [Leptolyngbya sp. SIO1D8]|nr:late competence development ComFB family protein [Leptolyngbya sp. SIO1D8]
MVMKAMAHDKVYINVMETLVAEEVDRYLPTLPGRVLKYIRRSDVETFALNRLPALYASSERGLQYQQDRAVQELKPQIVKVVRRAFAAVQADPIRFYEPIQFTHEDSTSTAVLQSLRDWLRSPDMTWEDALTTIRKLKRRGADARVLSQSSETSAAHRKPSVSARQSSHSGTYERRPGTYGGQSWQAHRSGSSSGGGFEDNYLR